MAHNLDSLPEQVHYLLDRAAVSDALIAFARAIDSRDWEGYADLYTEDGVLELPFSEPDGSPAGHVGRHGMADYVRAGLGVYAATHHLSGNHQITLRGDTATTVSYCQCVHRFGNDPGNVWELGGWYSCTLRRGLDGTWRFAGVHLDAVWQHGSPSPPGAQLGLAEDLRWLRFSARRRPSPRLPARNASTFVTCLSPIDAVRGFVNGLF